MEYLNLKEKEKEKVQKLKFNVTINTRHIKAFKTIKLTFSLEKENN